MSKLDEKYGVCEGYFYVYKSTKKLKTLKEAEDDFCKKRDKALFIKVAFEEMYFNLLGTKDMRLFGKFLASKNIIKNELSIWNTLGNKITNCNNHILADRWEKRSMLIIEAYKEFEKERQ